MEHIAQKLNTLYSSGWLGAWWGFDGDIDIFFFFSIAKMVAMKYEAFLRYR